jgi:hypothetical protein
LLVLLLLLGLAIVGSGCSPAGRKIATPVVHSAEHVAQLDRDGVRKLLERVHRTPTLPNVGPLTTAMCYSVALPPDRAEYICPKCGERTLYVNDEKTVFGKDIARRVDWDLRDCRARIEEIRKVAGEAIVLDESQYCRKCKPGVKEPALVLVATFNQGQPHSVSGVTADDLRLLYEFLSCKVVHAEGQDDESPMRDHLPRLEELLGVKRNERETTAP